MLFIFDGMFRRSRTSPRDHLGTKVLSIQQSFLSRSHHAQSAAAEHRILKIGDRTAAIRHCIKIACRSWKEADTVFVVVEMIKILTPAGFGRASNLSCDTSDP